MCEANDSDAVEMQTDNSTEVENMEDEPTQEIEPDGDETK